MPTPQTTPTMCQRCRTRLSLDRAPPSPRSAFIRARKAEEKYARLLRGVARQIGAIVRGFDLFDLDGIPLLRRALDRYAHTLEPWAQSVGARMVAEVAARDEQAWRRVGEEIGRGLRAEIASAPTGAAMRRQLADQVRLITSLPTEAAERVHRLTTEGIAQGWRSDRIAAEVMRTGAVTQARATLIARTEVSRTASALTQARAEYIGSQGYIWRTSRDTDVRPSHREMEGRFIAWDKPPTLDKLTGHAGCLPNCRCYAEPVIPD